MLPVPARKRSESGRSSARQRQRSGTMGGPERPYSFVNICEMLGLTPESVRAELLGELAPAPGTVFEELPLWAEVEEVEKAA